MWIVIVWKIWKQKNGLVFRNEKVDKKEVLGKAQVIVWAWITNKFPTSSFSYSN